MKFYGPFPVIARIGKQAGLVGRIHPVFHVSLLKPCAPGTKIAEAGQRLQLEGEDEEQEWLVEKILDSNVRSQELQCLVKWNDFPDEEKT